MIQFFPDSQTFLLFRIGTLTFDIRWYAVLIMFGAFLAYLFSKKAIRQSRYISLDFYDSLFIYTLWVGILGARLWFCLFFNASYYLAHPIEIIRIWDGGLAIQGGLVFGILFAYFYTRRNNYSFLKLADLILPNVFLGQVTGRWGNFVNQECHGAEVSEAYFDGVLSFLKEGMYINGHYYEPLFFYESILCLVGWLLIHYVLKKHQNKRGDLAYAYMMWYGVIRFFIEARRTDSLYFGNIKMAQLTSVLFLIIGISGYLGVFDKLFRRNKPTLFFDFDGTLIDTRVGIQEAYKALFEKYGNISDYTEEVKQEVLGPALKDLFPKYFPGIDYDTLYQDYSKRQKEVAAFSNHPMEHCEEVLKQLHEEGYKIAILSTRSYEGIETILNDYHLREYIDDICGVRDVEKVKPDPEGIFKLVDRNHWYRECVMIGDSLMDILCGKNYGAYTIAYCRDESRKEILSKEANTTVDDLKQIPEILHRVSSFTYDEI